MRLKDAIFRAQLVCFMPSVHHNRHALNLFNILSIRELPNQKIIQWHLVENLKVSPKFAA